MEVLHKDSAGTGAVAFPQLVAVDADSDAVEVDGSEEEGAVDVRQVRGTGAAGAGSNVSDERRARGGAVALPQLVVAEGRVGREQEGAVDVDPGRTVVEADGAREGILDGDGAGGGAVALPRPETVGVRGHEEEGAVDVGQEAG